MKVSSPRATKKIFHNLSVLILLCAAQFMVVLDFSIVNVALPEMQRELGFSPENLQWVVSAYAIAFGGFLLLGGRAADLVGRRRIFVVGLSLFTFASLIGGFAQVQWVLIVARTFQGLGGALVFPAALSLLTTTFRAGSERHRALATWGAMAAAGFSVGVLLGGVLTDSLGWQWVMFVNVPIGLLVMLFTPVLLKESQVSIARGRIDWAGAATVTIGLLLMVYAFIQAPETGWRSLTTSYLTIGAIAFLALFVWVESRAAVPLVPLKAFSQRILVGANLGAALMNASVAPAIFILTLYMQQVLGYSALQTGLAFLPYAVASIVAAPVASQLISQIGLRRTMFGGMVMMMVGLLLLSFIPVAGSFIQDLLVGTVIVGFGSIIVGVTTTIAATSGSHDSDQGLASGLLSTSQQIGCALGLAITIAVSTTRAKAIALSLSDSGLFATVGGFQAALKLGASLAAIGALVALFIIRAPKKLDIVETTHF
jgi:EmrB/QacA subfamily drug resistance transporter